MKPGKSVFPLIIPLLLLSCTEKGHIGHDAETLVVYGDSRSGHAAHRSIVEAIVEVGPAVVFHTGDLVNDGRRSEQWDTFNEIISILPDGTEFFPALGNHEYNSPLYFDNFDLPNNERWYSVERENAHFIILDTNWDLGIGSEQYDWLESDLEGVRKNVGFTAVIFHHPPFSTGPHIEDEMGLRDTVVPLFERHGVDIVFNGHDHTYERSHYNGIYYIVTGGGGAPLYDQVRESPYSLVFHKGYHFCTMMITGTELTVRVYSAGLDVLDEFSIQAAKRGW